MIDLRDAWIPRFRGHLEDTEKNELPKLKWRVDLLDFVISLHDLRDILKEELRYPCRMTPINSPKCFLKRLEIRDSLFLRERQISS